jgi:hypothetical protein
MNSSTNNPTSKDSQLYTRKGKHFYPSTAVDTYDLLPAGIYTIKQNPLSKEYYFEVAAEFQKPKKIYGSTMKYVERFLKTYQSRPQSTGILLMGEKGSGKTLTSKMLAMEAMKVGIPTIVVNEPHCGDAFNSFVQSINQECIFLFDEFEKTYNYEAQKYLLTLLDGVFPSKKLFVLTANENHIDYNMQNRPGRIFYKIDFGKLEADFVSEYCMDNLKNLSHLDEMMKLYALFDKFNFDMLAALVEEVNRFDESPVEASKWLNITAEAKSRYDFIVTYKGKEIKSQDFSPQWWHGHPLTSPINLELNIPELMSGEDAEWYDLRLGATELQKINPGAGTYVFQKGDFTVTLQKPKEYKFSADNYNSKILDWGDI